MSSTLLTFLRAIIERNFNQAFQGNMTHLKIDGFERLLFDRTSSDRLLEEQLSAILSGVLSGVTSLEVHTNQNVGERPTDSILIQNAWCLARILPSIERVDLGGLNVRNPTYICSTFGEQCPHLSRFTWHGCGDTRVFGNLHLDRYEFRQCKRLTELFLDDSFLLDTNSDYDMFERCRHLERLSIRNVTYGTYGSDNVSPLSQDILIKMVRRHPITLCWLQSDLTAENIAMLKQERPEITFVID